MCVPVGEWASQNASTNTWYNLVACCCSACKNIRMDTVQWFCAIKMLTLLLILFCCLCTLIMSSFFLSFNNNKNGLLYHACLWRLSKLLFLGHFSCHRCVEISESPYTHNPSSSLISFSYYLPPSITISHWLCSVRSVGRSFVLLGSLQFFSILHVYMSTIRFRCPSSVNSKQREYDEQTTIPCARTTACGKPNRKQRAKNKMTKRGKKIEENAPSHTHAHALHIISFRSQGFSLLKHFSFLFSMRVCYLSRTFGFGWVERLERVSPRFGLMRGVSMWCLVIVWIPTQRLNDTHFKSHHAFSVWHPKISNEANTYSLSHAHTYTHTPVSHF